MSRIVDQTEWYVLWKTFSSDINVNFIGICCGADPHHVREMAVAMGRKPIAYKYYPDMTKHFAHGN